MKIPFIDIQALVARQRSEMIAAAARVIDNGWFIHGKECEAFEKEFAAWVGSTHAVGVGNGLDGLTLTLRAWKEMGKVAEGDEVIVQANTFIASILAITEAGLTPVLVDPDERSFNMDVERVSAAITPRTRVLMPVHLYGQLTIMQPLMDLAARHQLLVLEDAAQSHGATRNGRMAGTIGDAAAFSFYPGKNLGALGDGGLVTTDDADLADLIRALGNYGSREKYRHDHLGPNSRLDEIQAAFLRERMRLIDADNQRRREIACLYLKNIHNSELRLPQLIDGPESHVWHLFVVRTNRRQSLRDHLDTHGVCTQIHYPIAPFDQLAYAAKFTSDGLALTAQLAREVLSLPISPVMTDEQADYVIASVNGWRW
jgi:dTDP-4-amino-4,6-dideoxygalactose transaminase